MPKVTCNEYIIDYIDIGKGHPVILLPGSGVGKEQWAKLSNMLLGQYRLLSVDYFGYGMTSAWPSDRRQTLDDQADLILRITEIVEGRVSLVGHSFGGAIAIKVASRLGSRLKNLCIIEPNLFNLLKANGYIDLYEEVLELCGLIKQFGARGKWTEAAALFIDHWNGEGTWDSLSDQRRNSLTNMVKPNLHEWDSILDEKDNIQRWQTFADRMLVLKGEKTHRSMTVIVDLLASKLNHLKVEEVLGCGHMLPVTHPHLVNPIIKSFLDQ